VANIFCLYFLKFYGIIAILKAPLMSQGYTGLTQTIDTCTTEQLGAFSGYIRRPKPNTNGMVAQIFGENGEDADTILALSLTKFQDAQVLVSVYIIKDSFGKVMKDGNKFPMVSQFLGFIRRSFPQKDGMLAQFFAPNGLYADNVANLSKSEYQDCLVFVDVRGIESINKTAEIEKENIGLINSNYLTKLTKQEKIEFSKKDKQFKKLNEILYLSDFFTKVEVMASLGSKEEYIEWLVEHKTCTHLQEHPCANDSSYVEVEGLVKPFNFLPACKEHEGIINGREHFEKNRYYYEMKHAVLLKSWASFVLVQKFSYDGKSQPNPINIIEWAINKKISQFLPKNYKATV